MRSQVRLSHFTRLGSCLFGAAGWLVLATALLAAGCQKQPSGQLAGSEATETELPPVEVKLPPPPSFQKEGPPESYADGALSVHGLRQNLDKYLDQNVTVRAALLEVYQCPPCPKGSKCKPCDMPHFWIADAVDAPKDKALMVVEYESAGKGGQARFKMQLKAGETYMVSGRFAKSSGSGFSAADGLLIYESHKPAM